MNIFVTSYIEEYKIISYIHSKLKDTLCPYLPLLSLSKCFKCTVHSQGSMIKLAPPEGGKSQLPPVLLSSPG